MKKNQHKAQTSKNISFHLLKSRRLESWNKRNQSKSFSSNQKRCLSYMLWFILCQYFETRRATPLVSRLFTQVKLPQTQVTLATCVEERNVSRQEKITFFALHLQRGSLSISMFTNAVVPWRWLSAGQIMIKLGHTHTVTAAFCCLTHSAKFRGQNEVWKCPCGSF